MIQKLICLIWGCKTVVKTATGKQFDTHHALYPDINIKGNYYTLTKLPFCARCGKKAD